MFTNQCFKVCLLVVAVLSLAACSTNPVTGKQEISLVSEGWELQTGKEQYAPARQSQGGDYVADPEVQQYVNEVGQRLAAVSDRKLPYEFVVINSDVPNAWALPGGKIAVNRGLLVQLESEAELAAVLGHEIVHAAAKHSAQQYQRGMLLQGALIATAVATHDEEYGALAAMGAGVGAQLVNTKYGRDAERESDHYGVKYMVKAGYDPQGAVDLQQTFVELAKKGDSNWLEGLFASHPPSVERLENNRKLAASYKAKGQGVGGKVGKERYQQVMAHLREVEPAYEAYANAQKALKNNDEKTARQELAKAINIEPREGHFYALLGDIEYKNKHWDKALKQFDKAVTMNPGFFYYPLRRGLVYKELDQPDKAKADLNRSIKLLPTSAAKLGLGNVAQFTGQTDQAKQFYSEAAQMPGADADRAYMELLKLDLPANPNRYLKVLNKWDRSNQWVVEVQNPTPVTLEAVVLQLVYVNDAGKTVERRVTLTDSVQPNTRAFVATGQQYNGNYAAGYKARVVSLDVNP